MNALNASLLLWVPAASGLSALLLAYAGAACLALAMDRHHHAQAFAIGVGAEVPARRRRALRGAGALLLAAAVWACAQGWGGWRAPVLGFGLFPLAAWLLIVLLPYRAGWVRPLAWAAGVLGLALLGLAVWRGGSA